MSFEEARWLDVSVRDVPELVAACCVLHNMREVHGDNFNEEWLEGVESGCNTSTNIVGSSQSESGVNIRQAVTAYFSE